VEVGVDGEASAAPPVVVDDPGSAGMAYISASLMEKAVAGAPELASRMKGSLTLLATDYRTGVTIRFEGSRVAISGSVDARAWLAIEGEALVLARLGGGAHELGALRRGGVRVRGLARHPLFALRLRRLLAAAQPS
jgi:septum formation inhibitor MinC